MSKSEILTKFETLATIPHCSYDTDKMRDFLADFARDKGCEVVVDSFGNVHVYKGKPKSCNLSYKKKKWILIYILFGVILLLLLTYPELLGEIYA